MKIEMMKNKKKIPNGRLMTVFLKVNSPLRHISRSHTIAIIRTSSWNSVLDHLNVTPHIRGLVNINRASEIRIIFLPNCITTRPFQNYDYSYYGKALQ